MSIGVYYSFHACDLKLASGNPYSRVVFFSFIVVFIFFLSILVFPANSKDQMNVHVVRKFVMSH